MYLFLLDGRSRSRVEQHARIVLNDTQAATLAVSRKAHICVVVCIILSSVYFFGTTTSYDHLVFSLALDGASMMLIGGLVTSVWRSQTGVGETAARACRAFGLSFGGWAFGWLFQLPFLANSGLRKAVTDTPARADGASRCL